MEKLKERQSSVVRSFVRFVGLKENERMNEKKKIEWKMKTQSLLIKVNSNGTKLWLVACTIEPFILNSHFELGSI